jgi:hypothetical protein
MVPQLAGRSKILGSKEEIFFCSIASTLSGAQPSPYSQDTRSPFSPDQSVRNVKLTTPVYCRSEASCVTVKMMHRALATVILVCHVVSAIS